MEFTNKHKLPTYIEDWLKNDDYDYNHDPMVASTTALMRPIRIQVLNDRHGGRQEIDIVDLLASRLGRAIHDSIERIETEDVDKEKRVSKEVSIGDVKYTVTGKYDILYDNKDDTHTLRDVKTTSVWAFIHGGKDEDYCQQMSIYRWLLSDTKTVRDVGYIDFFFTDWQSAKAKTEYDYPNHRIQHSYPVKLMSLDETEAFVRSKLEQIERYKDADEKDLPLCTAKELWATEDKYAVHKPGNKKASKLCASKPEAQQYILDKKVPGGYIEYRKGKAKRCKYCPVAAFCSQFKDLSDKGLIDNF